MRNKIILDDRKLKELQHALYYRSQLAHGTTGHNQLMLLGELADAMGFSFDQTGVFQFNSEDVRLILEIEIEAR